MKLNFNKKDVEIKTNYDYNSFREFKHVPDVEHYYKDDKHSWLVPNEYIHQLLTHLHMLNINVREAMNEVKDSITEHKTYHKEFNEEIVKTVNIEVVKVNQKSIQLKFDYDDNIMKYIKLTNARKWNPKPQTWTIQKVEIPWLYGKLKGKGYIDMSALKEYVDDENVTITPEDFPNMQEDRVPKEYQLRDAERMVSLKKTILAHEAGLGKTMTTVMAMEKIGKKAIIVTTASAKYNWEKEIKIVNPNANVNVLESKNKYKDAHYVVLNYDIMEKFMPALLGNGFEVVVFDEGHKLRGVNDRGNPKSKRARNGLKISENMKYVYPVTATPIINKNKDIFNLLVAICHPDSRYWNMWANTFCVRQTEFGKDYNNSYNREELNERLYPDGVLRIKTEEKEDLPERIRSFVPININLKRYEKQIEDYMNKRDKIEDNGKHLVELNIMRQTLAKEKMKEAVKMAKDYIDQDKKVVLFTNVSDVADKLAEKFEDKAVKVVGGMTGKQRQEAVDEFQNGDAQVFVGNVEAAGEAITLTAAHHMIVVDFHWSPIVMVNQMEKRIHRLSQDYAVKIEYLYAVNSHLEETIVRLLNQKLKDATKVIDGTEEEFVSELVTAL